MKVSIFILCLTLFFGFAKSQFIVIHKKLAELHKLKQDGWMDQVKIGDCSNLETFPVFIGVTDSDREISSDIKDAFSVGNGLLLDLEEVRTQDIHLHQKMNVRFGYFKYVTRNVSTVTCKYKQSMVYVAQHSNINGYLLFGKKKSVQGAPVLLGAILLLTVNKVEDGKPEFLSLLKNDKIKNEKWCNTSFCRPQGINNFEICAQFAVFSQKIVNLNYPCLLKIRGTDNFQLTLLEPNNYNKLKHPQIPAVQCDIYNLDKKSEAETSEAKISEAKISEAETSEARITVTFFFVPHPKDDNKLFVIMDHKGRRVFMIQKNQT